MVAGQLTEKSLENQASTQAPMATLDDIKAMFNEVAKAHNALVEAVKKLECEYSALEEACRDYAAGRPLFVGDKCVGIQVDNGKVTTYGPKTRKNYEDLCGGLVKVMKLDLEAIQRKAQLF